MVTLYSLPQVDIEPFGTRLQREGISTERLKTPVQPGILRGKSAKVILTPAALVDAGLVRALDGPPRHSTALVLIGSGGSAWQKSELRDLVAAHIAWPISEEPLVAAIRTSLAHLEVRQQARRVQDELDRRTSQYEQLLAVGIAMAGETDPDRLQDLMLRKAREMTHADAGSLYLVQETPSGEKELLFLYAQNDSLDIPFTRLSMPLTSNSISGYVALTGQVVRLADAYDVQAGVPYHHNRGFDERCGYRTKSMLTLPLFDHRREVFGVLQLMNRKRRFNQRLNLANCEREIQPFSDEDEQTLRAFAGHAAAALETKLLVESVETLFDGFVKAAATAVESRDPTTSGHSRRVADLTVGLAEAVNRVDQGPLRNVHFDSDQLREIRYSALLHDFGKIGVREHVLVKSKKLYPWQLDRLTARFSHAKRSVEAKYSSKKLVYLLDSPRDHYDSHATYLDAALGEELVRLDEYWRIILEANEPTILEEESAERLAEIAILFYEDMDGSQKPLLEPDELRLLSVRRGSLDEAERCEIESHVVHTHRFLTQIPWTRNLLRVPEFAAAHHERMDGSGYPHGLRGEAIPVQARIMTIADVWDALTASDRPYKPAVPNEKALAILESEARAGKIDRVLLDVFIQFGVHRLTERGGLRLVGDSPEPHLDGAEPECAGALLKATAWKA